jgi:hypothetical protein
MDAKEYLLKVRSICDDYQDNFCVGCPLENIFCGVPTDPENEENEIYRIVKFVESYEKDKE